MMSFGDTLTDTRGPTRSFPGVSAVTGLLANALGWRRTQPERLQALHDSLLIGSRIDRDPMWGRPALDYQTADLNHDDAGWTTHGVVETRSGDAKTFESQHLRFREYIADCRVITALRTCLRTPEYIMLRLLPRRGNHVSFLSQRHQPGAICFGSADFADGPTPDQAPHRRLVRCFSWGAVCFEKRLSMAHAARRPSPVANLLQILPAME